MSGGQTNPQVSFDVVGVLVVGVPVVGAAVVLVSVVLLPDGSSVVVVGSCVDAVAFVVASVSWPEVVFSPPQAKSNKQVEAANTPASPPMGKLSNR